MTSRRNRLDAAAPQKEREPEADEAQRRLGVLRELQLVVVRGGEQASQLDIRSAGAALAQVCDLGIIEQLSPHACVLRALARIDKRDPGHRRYCVLITSRPA